MPRRTALAQLLAFRPPVALTSPRSHKRTDALVRARDDHLRVDNDEDPDEEFAVDTVDSGSEIDNGSESESESDSDDEGNDWHDCLADVWGKQRGQFQILTLVYSYGDYYSFAANAIVSTAVFFSGDMFELRDLGGLSSKQRLRSLGYRQRGALLDGVSNTRRCATGVIDWLTRFLRGGADFSGDLAAATTVLTSLDLLKLDVDHGTVDVDGDRVAAVVAAERAVFGAQGGAGHQFCVERALQIQVDFAMGTGLRDITLAVQDKIKKAHCNHGTGPCGTRHLEGRDLVSRTDFRTGACGDVINEIQLFQAAPWIPV